MLPGFPGGPRFDWVSDMARSGPPNSTKLSEPRGPQLPNYNDEEGERRNEWCVTPPDFNQRRGNHPQAQTKSQKERERERETFIRLLVFYSVADFIQSVITRLPLGSISASWDSWVWFFFDHLRDALHATMQIASWVGSVRIHGICQPPTNPRRREGSGKNLQL